MKSTSILLSIVAAVTTTFGLSNSSAYAACPDRAMARIKIDSTIKYESKLTENCHYWIYDIIAQSISAYGLVSPATPSTIDLSNASTTHKSYRIYFSEDANLLPNTTGAAALEPNGYTHTSSAFSFVEYSFGLPVASVPQINLDVSYINDWAYPIQINDGTNIYGFSNSNGVVSQLTSTQYAAFLPKSASSLQPVGNSVDLYDRTNQRFTGPLSVFANQTMWANWTFSLSWPEEATWAPNAASSWMQFGADVPFGAMPFSGADSTPPGTGFLPSKNATQTQASFSNSLPHAPASWPAWLKQIYNKYPTPQYGFDFSTAYPFNPANSNDVSGEDQSLPTNFAVWNFGYSKYETDIPANNVSPDNYKVNGVLYSNGYTEALRAQAHQDKGQHENKSGFFTFPKDNYNAEFDNKNLSDITLILWPKANLTHVGTHRPDRIYGTTGDDVFLGGGKGDTLIGHPKAANGDLSNGGSDVFVYNLVEESRPGKKSRDRITDFQSEDRIDLSGFDANPELPGLQPFIWIGDNPFDAPGQLRIHTDRHGTLLQGNLDQDRKPEFEVFLQGSGALMFGTQNLLLRCPGKSDGVCPPGA